MGKANTVLIIDIPMPKQAEGQPLWEGVEQTVQLVKV